MPNHNQAVIGQFDPKAEAYLTSSVHARGPDLEQAALQVQSMANRQAMLDVGCGAGHLGFRLAEYFQRVVATDLSPSMLDTVRTAAAQRGLPQIEVRQTGAESLPFPDAHFDLVSSRYSAHHWNDVPAGLREMRRVMRPGGSLLMIDLMGDESPLIDTHLQAVELLRDPSHVRDYSPSQWRGMLQNAGFEVQSDFFWPTRMEFRSWVERMRTPDSSAAVIRTLLAAAAQEVQRGLSIEPDGSFTPATGLFWARAA